MKYNSSSTYYSFTSSECSEEEKHETTGAHIAVKKIGSTQKTLEALLKQNKKLKVRDKTRNYQKIYDGVQLLSMTWFALSAIQQYSGIGRNVGSHWDSLEGNVHLSIFIKQIDFYPDKISQVPMIVGSILLNHIREFQDDSNKTFKLKWPNDIVYSEKERNEDNVLLQSKNGTGITTTSYKVAGILIHHVENVGIIIGIGVNLCTIPNLTNKDNRCSLLSPGKIKNSSFSPRKDCKIFISSLIPKIVSTVTTATLKEKSNFSLMDIVNFKRDIWMYGKQIKIIMNANSTKRGKLVGFNPASGALLLSSYGGKVEEIYYGSLAEDI